MTPEQFENSYLSKGTAHPACQQRRLRFFQKAAWAIFLISIGGPVVWTFINFEGLRDLVQAGYTIFRIVLLTVTFLLAFLTTTILTMKVSAEYRRIVDARWRGLSSLRRSSDWIAVILGVVLGIFAWLLLAYLSGLDRQIAFLFNFFSLFPLIAVLLFTSHGKGKRDGENGGARHPLRNLLYFLIFLIIVTLFFDVWGEIRSTSIHQFIAEKMPFYRPFWTAVILVPLSYVLWLICREEEKKDEEEDEETEEPPSSASSPPAWIKDLLEILPEHCSIIGEVKRLDINQGCNWSNSYHLRRIFNGHLPTSHQEEAFTRFRELYLELVTGTRSSGKPPVSSRTADLILEGHAGVGRTTLFTAYVFEAALNRGQSVLWLVPDEEEGQEVLHRAECVASQLKLDGFFIAKEINRSAVLNAVRNVMRMDEQQSHEDSSCFAMPNLWVGTLAQAEDAFYGEHIPPDDIERLRLLLEMIQVVLVDDFLEFGEAESHHLPFFLDKHRLYLEALGLQTQFVIGTPPLTDFARPLVGNRLLVDGRFSKNENFFQMAPRPSSPCWHLRLQTERPEEVLEPLVNAVCNASGELDVILYRPNLDLFTRREVQQRIENSLPPRSGTFEVVSRTGALSNATSSAAGAIIHEITSHHDHGMALFLNYGHEQTVLVDLASADDLVSEKAAGIVPILISQQATPFMVSHLLSMKRVLPGQLPAPVQCWNSFVFTSEKDIPNTENALVELTINEDRPVNREQDKRLWPWMSLDENNIAPAFPVEVCQSPTRDYTLKKEDDDNRWSVLKSEEEDKNLAKWVTRLNQTPLGRYTDMTLAHEFRLTIDRNVWASDMIEPSDGDFLAQIEATHYRGDGNEHIFPVWDLSFTLPHSVSLRRVQGHGTAGLMMASIEDEDEVDYFPIWAKLAGRISEYGRPESGQAHQSLAFTYLGHLNMIMLGPRNDSQGNLPNNFEREFAGIWKTGLDNVFWPELTAAFQYAMEVRAGGYSSLCRVIAFDLSQQNNSPCLGVIYVIEPRKVGHSILPVLTPLLFDDLRERCQLFRAMDWMLGHLEKANDQQTALRRFARVGFVGDAHPRDLRKARELSQYIIHRSEVELGWAQGQSWLIPAHR